MQQNAVRLGYFLAISLLLASLFYFFASNWPALDRWEKIGVSASVLALFYVFSFIGSLLLKKQAFLSNWLLAAGGISFGVSVALLGQIYNTHADSYMLFVVWLVPNLLFAFFTRYQPFYVISYVLAHLALWFFLDPSAIHVIRSEEWWYLIFWLIALGNIVLFWLTSTERLHSRAINYLSFVAFELALFLSAFVEVYGVLPEVLYSLVGAGLFVMFLKWHPHRGMLVGTAAMLALFLLGKFFWFMLEYYSEWFFVIGLLVAAAIVWGTVLGVNWLRKESGNQDRAWVRFFQEALTVLVTTVAASIGAISLTGLIALLFDGDSVGYFLFFLALIGFIGPVVALSQMNSTVRYTLQMMGYLIGGGTAMFLDGYLWMLFLLVLGYVWYAITSIPSRLLTQLAFLVVLFVELNRWIDSQWIVLVLMFVFQISMYLLPRLPRALQNSSLVYSLLALLALTEYHFGTAASICANIAFLAVSTSLVYRCLRAGGKADFGIAIGFWFVFLLMKYYDLLWSLLHKSISLLILSLVFFGVSYWLDRRTKIESVLPQPPVFSHRRGLLLSVILLQFALLGYQIWSNESILSKGQTVKLELMPVDPRSLLQGDYVRLAYRISRLDEENSIAGKKVRVVLRKQSDGVYGYGGYLELDGQWNRPYEAQPSDVMINGRTTGAGGVEYGIETYFVPEGTGLEVQRKAKYAYVKIGHKGDAIVERLSEN